MQPEVSSSYCLGFGLQHTERRNKKTPEESKGEAESQVCVGAPAWALTPPRLLPRPCGTAGAVEQSVEIVGILLLNCTAPRKLCQRPEVWDGTVLTNSLPSAATEQREILHQVGRCPPCFSVQLLALSGQIKEAEG